MSLCLFLTKSEDLRKGDLRFLLLYKQNRLFYLQFRFFYCVSEKFHALDYSVLCHRRIVQSHCRSRRVHINHKCAARNEKNILLHAFFRKRRGVRSVTEVAPDKKSAFRRSSCRSLREILVYRVKHGLAAFAVKRTEFFDMRGKVVTRQELIRHHLREHGRMNVRNLLCYNHFCDKVAVTRYVADADSRGQNF